MVREYVGNHYSEEGTQTEVPLNLLAMFISIYTRSLFPKNPRVQLSTFCRAYKPMVKTMEAWANREIERQEMTRTFQRLVLDALFSVGICKVALATPADAATHSWAKTAGEPFTDVVDLDDFVFDVHARDFSQADFLGHRYRVPLEAVRDSKIYGPARKKVEATKDQQYNHEGDERIGVMGRGYYSDHEEFLDHVDLWEFFLPKHRMVITLWDEQLSGGDPEPLRVQNWLGPLCGPYHFLGYGVVPGNPMPKAPVQDLVCLHTKVNILLRKLIRQAERQKSLLLVRGGAMEDGERVMNANDGDILRNDNPEACIPMTFGEPNQPNFGITNALKQFFDEQGGNLSLLGGLAPQSRTATQDRMLNENSSRTMEDMQQRTFDFTSSVLRSNMWFWWNDPFKVMSAKHSMPGIQGMEIIRTLTPDRRRQIRFEDVDFSLDMYSLQHQTPQSRIAALNGLFQQILIPLAPILQSQGVIADINSYLEKMARYHDMPDLVDIVTVREPPEPDTESAEPTRTLPQKTERTYTRENVPMRTQRGDSMNLTNTLMGVDTGGATSNGRPK